MTQPTDQERADFQRLMDLADNFGLVCAEMGDVAHARKKLRVALADALSARRAQVVPEGAIARIDEALNQLPFDMQSDSFVINNGPPLKNSAGETMFYGKNMVLGKLTILADALRDARDMLATAPQPPEAAKAECWCLTCRPLTLQDMRFVICPDCGNKRCPKANNHANACTNSNAPGQTGSNWEHVKPLAEAACNLSIQPKHATEAEDEHQVRQPLTEQGARNGQ